MIARSLTARLAASVIAAGVLLTTATGCNFIATQATYLPYDPADGVGANLGDVVVRDVRAVLSDDGEALSILFAAINNGDEHRVLTIAFDGEGGETVITVPTAAGESVLVGLPGATETAIIEQPGRIVPGQNIELYVQAGDADGVLIEVPVFDSTNPLYTDLVPEIEVVEVEPGRPGEPTTGGTPAPEGTTEPQQPATPAEPEPTGTPGS